MKYTKLGQTNIDVSRITLGTMTWGIQNSQEEAFEQIDYALSQGVNFWDTAEMYPTPPSEKNYAKTEEIIGNWFKQTGRRKEVVVATKFSPVPWARNEENPQITRENIITAVNNSLKRLQTDYIDLYQFHWITNRPSYHFAGIWNYEPATSTNKQTIMDNILEILQTCDELIKQGKIKHIGLSNDTPWGMTQFLNLAEKHNLPRIVSLQNEYSLLRRRDDTDVIETCALEDISYLAWSPLNMGIISGKYLDGKIPANTRFATINCEHQENRFMTRMNPTVDEAVREYIDVAKKHDLDVCQMAIAFTIRKPYYSTSIIGATTMDQLKNAISAVDIELSDEVLNDIAKVRAKYPAPF